MLGKISWVLWVAFLSIAPASAQQGRPGQGAALVGYVYPAGGCRNSEFTVDVGGAALSGTHAIRISGGGVSAEVLKHFKPLNNMVENKIRDAIKAEREKRTQSATKENGKGGNTKGGKGKGGFLRDEELVKEIGIREGFTEDEIDAFIEMVMQRRDPKRQMNVQLAERVTLRVRIDANAVIGRRDLRLLGPNGLSNPLSFVVSGVPELSETEANNSHAAADPAKIAFPVVINGRILPGDVDCFAFEARKGMKLTAAVSARELTPYLADAVPGWFQAVATLYDARGREVMSKSGFAHRPDPMINLTIPADGRYVLQIRDSISRGREDFVYRILLGEIPCLTEQFPAGGQLGTQVPVRVSGWNLPLFERVVDVGNTPGTRMIPLKVPIIGFMQFEASEHPEFYETDGDENSSSPRELVSPCTINAVIQKPGHKDCYAFSLKKGQPVVAEIRARRLGSPLDSMLSVSGPDGKTVAANDDFDDPGSGLLTHHADSRVAFTPAADGVYHFNVWDTQGTGGRSHNYRLTVAPPDPGFDLKVTPSAFNGRPGASVTATAHVLRRDGFTGEVALSLVDASPGLSVEGGMVPAGKDSVQFTLKFSGDATPGVTPLRIQGCGTVAGHEMRRIATPAEDRMQAFFYRHLVEADEMLVFVSSKSGQGKSGQFLTNMIGRAKPVCENGVRVPAGGSSSLRLPGFARAVAEGNLTFVLASPPAGITLTSTPSGDGTELVFAADAKLLKPGALGNLIVEIHGKPSRAATNPDAAKKGRVVKLGTLSPIPCTVTATAASSAGDGG